MLNPFISVPRIENVVSLTVNACGLREKEGDEVKARNVPDLAPRVERGLPMVAGTKLEFHAAGGSSPDASAPVKFKQRLNTAIATTAQGKTYSLMHVYAVYVLPTSRVHPLMSGTNSLSITEENLLTR